MSYKPSETPINITTFQDAQVAMRETDVACTFIYGLHPQQGSQETTGTGAITNPNSMAKVATGTGTDGSAILKSARRIHYNPGFEIFAYFTALWPDGSEADTNLIIGPYNDLWGYAIGYMGNNFGVFRLNNGTWETVAVQADFNLDTLDGNGCSGYDMDKTRSQIFKVRMGYLGFVAATFSIYTGYATGWVDFHNLAWENVYAAPHSQETFLPVKMEATKTSGTAANVSLISACWGAGTLNAPFERPMDITFAAESSKSISANTETNIITVRVKSTYNSKTNHMFMYLRHLHAATEGNKSCKIRVKRNATLGGTPAWVDVDADSFMEYDVSGTTVTGGTFIDGLLLFGNSGGEEQYDREEYILNANETYTISAESAGSAVIDIFLNWTERF